MFRAAVLRLTLWYLLLIMLLSLSFSFALYKASTRELRGLEQRQASLGQTGLLGLLQPEVDQLNQQRVAQIEQSRVNIEWKLAYFNLVILVAGGAASYLLARRTLQPIETALETQTRFAADASHELRTPLTAMKTELQVALRDQELTLEQSRELHRSTLDEVGKLEALTKGLLTLAQGNEPGTVQEEDVQVDSLIIDAVERVSAGAATKDISIEYSPSELAVRSERWSLLELLSIILDNAVKYSPAGSRVGIRAHRQHGRGLVIEIEDAGRGIAAEDLPRIFQRFYRADPSRNKEQVSGYGLGLSIAHKLIERLRGSIEVRSALGKGSTFSVILPGGHARGAIRH